MKVTSIETAVLHVPCPRPMSLEFADHRMVAAFIDTDEGVRPGTTAESLGGLRPAFDKNGSITAGNSSQISDGGCAVVALMPAPVPNHEADKAARYSISALGGR